MGVRPSDRTPHSFECCLANIGISFHLGRSGGLGRVRRVAFRSGDIEIPVTASTRNNAFYVPLSVSLASASRRCGLDAPKLSVRKFGEN
jgi:hypothetical protein